MFLFLLLKDVRYYAALEEEIRVSFVCNTS
jgi:hypothetical protein